MFLTSALLLGLPGSAFAQASASAAQEAVPAETQNGEFEEIIVTAQRRQDTVQDVPLAITALSGSALRDAGKNDLDSALRTVPSVSIANAPAGVQVSIRGIGPAVTTDASVSINFDGIYQSDFVIGHSYDISRVEVLRGPQGTLYGRNATAGSVNFVANAPSLAGFEAFGSVQYGNYDALRTEAVVNVPITDMLAVRGAFSTSRRDGYYSNGSGAEDLTSGRLKLLFRPSDRVNLVVTGAFVHGGGTQPGTVTLPLSLHPDNAYFTTTNPGAVRIRRKEVYAQLDVDLGFGTVSWLPSYYSDYNGFDQEPLGRGLTAGGGGAEQHTEELRIASNAGSAIKWVVGAFYLDRRIDRDRRRAALVPGTRSPLVYPFVDTPEQNNLSKAVFGEITVPLTSTFRITGGLRYSKDDKDLLATAFINATTPSTTVPSVRQERTDSATTWKVGAEFDITPDNLLYAQVSTGYKSGGINESRTALVAGAIAIPSTYAPEHVTAYEVGSKNQMGAVQLNAAAFYYDYTNQQVLNTIAGAVVIREVLNAAKSTIYGGEIEGQFRLTDTTRLYGNLSYVHSRFGTFSYFNQLNPFYSPGSGTTINYSGRRGLNAPKWSGMAGVQQSFDTGAGILSASGEIRFYSSSVVGLEPTTLNVQPAYTLSDARLTYKTPDGRWTLTAFINNIENEPVKVFTLFAGPPGPTLVQRATLAPPRTYGLSLGVQF